MLRGVALGRLGQASGADEALLTARAFSICGGDQVLEAEVDFYAALDAFGAGRLGDARRALERSLDRAQARGATELGHMPLTHVIARGRELLGVIDAADGRYRDQMAHARAALALWDASDTKDVWQEAFAIANLAGLARDFDLEAEALSLEHRISSLRWTSELTHTRFRANESLAWCAMLRGTQLEALRRFRRMADTAASTPQRIDCSVIRAINARLIGHATMAAEEVEHALMLAYEVDWTTAPGDDRLTLLVLAQTAAVHTPVEARAMLDRYAKIRSSMPAVYASRLETRVRAEEAFTHGVVLRAEGQINASAARLEMAFTIWNEIGFEWRAARAAVELAELDAGDVFRLAVRRELRARPDSIFAERARLVA